ncbi:hypothetical protein [Niveispirillum cyanobacteriorum]|uniref:hypothetical protein n=1 Tax=Niveispirillum cyanobacteriorum TaxID=1612173 RepID=UPI0016636A23|nr:hypothetical protein [Niveispirillum cyanobacteriorum]
MVDYIMKIFRCLRIPPHKGRPDPQRRLPYQPKPEELAAAYRKGPIRTLRHARGDDFAWVLDNNPGKDGYFDLHNVSAFVLGYPIAWVEGISVNPKTGSVLIKHIAISKELRGYGLGPLFARAVRKKLLICFPETRRIVFRENHKQYWHLPYPRLFRDLGAVPRKTNCEEYAYSGRPEWIWDWSNSLVPGNYWDGQDS